MSPSAHSAKNRPTATSRAAELAQRSPRRLDELAQTRVQIGRERRRIRVDDSKIGVPDLGQHRIDAVDAGS